MIAHQKKYVTGMRSERSTDQAVNLLLARLLCLVSTIAGAYALKRVRNSHSVVQGQGVVPSAPNLTAMRETSSTPFL